MNKFEHVSSDNHQMSVLWQKGRRVGPQVKKFEQVSSDDHQSSVVLGGGIDIQVSCPGERGGGKVQ